MKYLLKFFVVFLLGMGMMIVVQVEEWFVLCLQVIMLLEIVIVGDFYFNVGFVVFVLLFWLFDMGILGDVLVLLVV